MKLLGLVAAMAIVLYAYKARVAPGKDSADKAMVEFEQTIPAQPNRSTAAAAPAASKETTGLRRPIDRTRNVLDQVKQRNGNGEF